MQTLIARTDAYKMEVSQDWKTFPWSRISLLSHPAAGWKSACSQILRGVLESRIQIHPAHGQQTWMMYGTNTDLTKNELGSLISAISLACIPWRSPDCHQGAYSDVSERAEFLECRIIILSMFNDIERTKKGKTESCLHSAKEVAAFAAHFKPGHWCFLGHVVERHYQQIPRTMDQCRIANG